MSLSALQKLNKYNFGLFTKKEDKETQRFYLTYSCRYLRKAYYRCADERMRRHPDDVLIWKESGQRTKAMVPVRNQAGLQRQIKGKQYGRRMFLDELYG